MAGRYRSLSNSSSGDESEDSDKESATWKRATKRKIEEMSFDDNQEQEMVSEDNGPRAKRKRNTIWSDILQDEVISEDLGGCLLKNKPADFYDRGHESYDYTLKYTDRRLKKTFDVEMAEGDAIETEGKSVSSRGSGRPSAYVPLSSEEKEAVSKINRVLNEKKVYLIRRIVKNLGIEKAMNFLKMVEEIEENGGMMIANHTRRRTPGGVYIQLLKSAKDIPKETIDKIFEGEMNPYELKKHYQEINKQKKMLKKAKKMSSSAPELDTSEKDKSIPSSLIVSDKKEVEEAVMEVHDPIPVTSKSSASDLEDGEISD